jgi:hypothetical protein
MALCCRDQDNFYTHNRHRELIIECSVRKLKKMKNQNLNMTQPKIKIKKKKTQGLNKKSKRKFIKLNLSHSEDSFFC